MTKKRGLGKGLQALMPVTAGEPVSQGVLKEIRVTDIRPNPKQPRLRIDPDKLNELVESIREYGVVQPVVVRAQPGGYELIAGERRWRACQQLGLEYIPAVVREYGELQSAAIALIENLQRENLNPLEEATAYRRLMDEFQLTQDQVSQRVGKSRPQIANMIRLLSLPNEIKIKLSNGEISVGHARALLALESRQLQLEACELITKKQLSVRQAEELVNNLLTKQSEKEKVKKEKTKNPDIMEIEDQLRSSLGTKVQIKTSRRGGKIEIDYYDDNDLNRLLELLLAQNRQMA
ncbi:ParB/RepB/Spo0J family partition protein [Desulforamulus hydrothermalis]|uniref:Stage 0 sporulation protein J n=1 Tax=Desulforamulus hydrothermalis Lam5 = DSM 18033 TaxID=1121428 RepID=K8E9R4_9FIRM|nr:ParB/RepB/Spo0J family partition protein [Desulforamulus hydrothermalis]CCO08328.1 Stage 0 sporulation protein J [Desulforamulus hydrothermalis Lam5 = DSM 18033]SHH45162.1 chromosome partitioning protein, ParB family [Desulforamulus hydrothermalis Lam5 = DSM 18033]